MKLLVITTAQFIELSTPCSEDSRYVSRVDGNDRANVTVAFVAMVNSTSRLSGPWSCSCRYWGNEQEWFWNYFHLVSFINLACLHVVWRSNMS